MGFLKSIFGGAPKGPSPEEIRRKAEEARKRERERLEREQKEKAEAELTKKESRRKAFAGQLVGVDDDEEKRKRFLKGG